jgi:hypothetical protein
MDFVDFSKWYLDFAILNKLCKTAHAGMEWMRGDDTVRRGSQVWLDGTPHIGREPIGAVMVSIISSLIPTHPALRPGAVC